ncbi:apelin receptor [Hydra vulgaris]|uniref:Apelin receptor n=1 Tax=Hydra vulgaris TaxID=6087 RepID=A0ABM4B5N3_HYDVU
MINTTLDMINATLLTNLSLTKTFNEEVKTERFNTVNITTLILFAVIFLVGTIGNALVLYYFHVKDRHLGMSTEKRRVSEFLFSVLAIVDFFAAFLNPILYMYWIVTDYKWHLGYWSCKILVPLGTVATTMSGGIIAVLSFDRHRAIVYPLKKHFKLFHIKISIVLVLFYALVINVYYSINISLNIKKECFVVDPSKKAYSIPTIIYFLVNDITLLFVINFTNYRIVSKRLVLSSSSTPIKMQTISDCKRRQKDNNRIIRLLVVMTIVFFILTLPRDVLHFVFLMSWLIGSGINRSKEVLNLNSFLKVFNVANSCVNPIIFYAMHPGFNKFIKSIFCKSKWLFPDRKISLNEMETLAGNKSVIY